MDSGNSTKAGSAKPDPKGQRIRRNHERDTRELRKRRRLDRVFRNRLGPSIEKLAAARKPKSERDETTTRFITAYEKFTVGRQLEHPELMTFPTTPADAGRLRRLIEYTRKQKNTALLIEYLLWVARFPLALPLDPELASVMADALKGGWKKRRVKAKDPVYFHTLHENVKAMLREGVPEAEALAKNLGAKPGNAGGAKLIAAHLLQLRPASALDWLMYPRRGRLKKG